MATIIVEVPGFIQKTLELIRKLKNINPIFEKIRPGTSCKTDVGEHDYTDLTINRINI